MNREETIKWLRTTKIGGRAREAADLLEATDMSKAKTLLSMLARAETIGDVNNVLGELAVAIGLPPGQWSDKKMRWMFEWDSAEVPPS